MIDLSKLMFFKPNKEWVGIDLMIRLLPNPHNINMNFIKFKTGCTSNGVWSYLYVSMALVNNHILPIIYSEGLKRKFIKSINVDTPSDKEFLLCDTLCDLNNTYGILLKTSLKQAAGFMPELLSFDGSISGKFADFNFTDPEHRLWINDKLELAAQKHDICKVAEHYKNVIEKSIKLPNGQSIRDEWNKEEHENRMKKLTELVK